MPANETRERIVVRSADPAVVERLCAELNVPPLLATLLAVRGLSTYTACERFFNPSLEQLHDPFLFGDMAAAVERIGRAVRERERVTVYGDYDVDGITSSAMLCRMLRRLGLQCDCYLPNRLTEGYGMSAEGVRAIAERGSTLIVTVDCGIGAAQEVALARELGIDTVVTDHHEPHTDRPGAVAVLNPRVEGCGYPFADLAGVGVALKVCQALCVTLADNAPWWQDYLDLAALGTAADIVPMSGENRAIVAEGLKQVQQGRNPGLRALACEQGLEQTDIHTHHVVFQLAPCINAAGRLGEPTRALELLLTDEPAVAAEIASELAYANRERRALNEVVEREAMAWVEGNCEPGRDMAIVAGSESWHKGVVGIVASKMVERFHRPALLFSIEHGVAHGSGRTIPGLHLLDTLGSCAELFDTYGGHAAAAGMTLRAERLGELRERFNAEVARRLGPDDLVPVVHADAEVRLDELTQRAYRVIERMRPFGPGNMRPVLFCRELHNARDPRIVGGKHLKLTVSSNGATMDAIAFGFGERIADVNTVASYSLAFCLDENEWNGRKSLQLAVKGIEV